MKYIAEYEGSCGIGDSLEEAHEALKEQDYDARDIDDVAFYEATLLDVEVKIMQKKVPVKATKQKLPE